MKTHLPDRDLPAPADTEQDIIADPETEAREFAPFAKIRDNYPKFLLTLDPLLQRRDGIRHLNLLDVLTGRETLFP